MKYSIKHKCRNLSVIIPHKHVHRLDNIILFISIFPRVQILLSYTSPADISHRSTFYSLYEKLNPTTHCLMMLVRVDALSSFYNRGVLREGLCL